MMRLVVLFAIALSVPALAAPPSWQRDITGADRTRLAKLWEAWTRGVNEAQAAGHGAALTALGPMAVPDAATMNAAPAKAKGPMPVAGDYRCRTVKLGQRAGAPSAHIIDTGASWPCRIEARGNAMWFEQTGGAQRLGGQLYADGGRMVFLGSTALAGEMGVMPYGADPQRDVVGALRAIGDRHWRLELPWPNWQSNLAIVEILPA